MKLRNSAKNRRVNKARSGDWDSYIMAISNNEKIWKKMALFFEEHSKPSD